MSWFDELNFPGVLKLVPITQAAAGTNVVAAAVSGQRVRLFGINLTMVLAGSIQFQDTGAGALSGPITLGLGVPYVLPIAAAPWFETGGGLGLQIVGVTGGFNGSAMVIQS
jgi:hypothetical protein